MILVSSSAYCFQQGSNLAFCTKPRIVDGLSRAEMFVLRNGGQVYFRSKKPHNGLNGTLWREAVLDDDGDVVPIIPSKVEIDELDAKFG